MSSFRADGDRREKTRKRGRPRPLVSERVDGFGRFIPDGLRLAERSMQLKVLIVDDQASARHVLKAFLSAEALVSESGSLAEARTLLAAQVFDVAFLDLRLDERDLTNRDGLALVEEIRRHHTDTLPIVVSGSADLGEIRQAMRSGAYDYLFKDQLSEELVLPILERVRSQRTLEREVQTLRARASGDVDMVGTSVAMRELRALIDKAALSDRAVLIVGPTGAGKELAVQALHRRGPHPDARLLDVNCAAIPESLMESQLFGHEKGAFTGADKRHEGFFAGVGEGTLFLDEIGELPAALQSKLLRVLETRRFRPVGGGEDKLFSGRVVAATHVDLEARVAARTFREDLYYRLNVLTLRVPALAERREDIPALVGHFCRQQSRRLHFGADALAQLTQAHWPGNVRQLRNVIDRVAVFADDDAIDASTVTRFMQPSLVADRLHAMAHELLRSQLPNKLEAIEAALISEAMALCDGNKTAASALLGIHRKAMERRLLKAAT